MFTIHCELIFFWINKIILFMLMNRIIKKISQKPIHNSYTYICVGIKFYILDLNFESLKKIFALCNIFVLLFCRPHAICPVDRDQKSIREK